VSDRERTIDLGRPCTMTDHVKVERSRLRMLAGGAALALTLAIPMRSQAAPDSSPAITVYKSPT
jgi:hypothetical protein